MESSEALHAFYELYLVLSESRSSYGRPGLKKVMETYEKWMKVKSEMGEEELRELREWIDDYGYLLSIEKLGGRVRRLIERLKEKYVELGIKFDDPLADLFYKLYQEAEYILDDVLKRGLPLTVESLGRYIGEGMFEDADFSASVLEVLRSVRGGRGMRLGCYMLLGGMPVRSLRIMPLRG